MIRHERFVSTPQTLVFGLIDFAEEFRIARSPPAMMVSLRGCERDCCKEARREAQCRGVAV